MMNRILLFTVVTFALSLCGCNSVFRSNKTQIKISQDVAKYLAKTEMIINNNNINKQINRPVNIEYLKNDTLQPRLSYRRVKGTVVVLQIKDSLGHQRHVAIPQVELKAYPLLLSTTASPSITYFLLTSKKNQQRNILATLFYQAIALNLDLWIGATSMLGHPNRRYAVPKSFSINQLSEVATLDSVNPNFLQKEGDPAEWLNIPLPINPNPTPFLTANYQKKFQCIFTVNSGYGINQAHSTILMDNQTSRVHLPNKLSNGMWTSFGLLIQPRANYQWGFSYHTKTDPNLSCDYLLNEIGFLIPFKKSHFEIGGGLGWGMTKHTIGNNYVDSFTTFQNKPVGAGQLLEEDYKFIPDVSHAFLPINGHVQFIYPIKKNIEIAASASYSRIRSYSDFIKTETLLITQTITPTITSYKRDELSYQHITVKTVNQIYTLGLSIRAKI